MSAYNGFVYARCGKSAKIFHRITEIANRNESLLITLLSMS